MWLLPLLTILACVIVFVLSARLLRPSWHKTVWWKQLVFIAAGGLLGAVLGSILTYPTGPGSERIVFAVLAAYAFLLLLFGPRFTKFIGVVLLCVFLGAFAISTRNKNHFEKTMRMRVEQMKTYEEK